MHGWDDPAISAEPRLSGLTTLPEHIVAGVARIHRPVLPGCPMDVARTVVGCIGTLVAGLLALGLVNWLLG
jgi:hypothetical protein